MHSIIFVGSDEAVLELEPNENPSDSFPCMSTLSFHRDARAQLYSLVTGDFLDDAIALEILLVAIGDDGPFVYKLDDNLMHLMSRLEEDEVASLATNWMACEELESLDVTESDATEFIFQYAHFCYTASNDDELGVYLFSDS